MAKKPVKTIEQDVIRKDGGLAEILEDDLEVTSIRAERGEQPASADAAGTVSSYSWNIPKDVRLIASEPATSGADDSQLWGFDCIALDAEGKPRVLAPQDATMQGASVVLPRAVLIALLDPAHELADAETAEKLRLIERGEPTPIGALVIAGTDQTALRHKMAARWRETHNAALSKKG